MTLRGELHPNAKLKTEEVVEIRKLYEQGFSIKIISRNYKISAWNVKNIVNRKTWTHI